MKSFIKIFILAMITPMVMQAQNHKCGTEDAHILLDRITKNRKFAEANPHLFKSSMPIYIPIKWILVAEFDGTGRAKLSAVLDHMCILNSYYNDFDIYFYLDNNGTAENPDYFKYLDHTGIFNDPRTTSSMTTIRQNKDDNAISIFVINDAGSSGATTSAGFYSPFGDYIVVEKSQLISNETLMAHEIGHFLSLAHPHTGWEDTGWGNADPNIFNPVLDYGTTITQTTVQSSQSAPLAVELVNGTNCASAGDRICDTPADYGFGPHLDNCFFGQEVFDRNGDNLDPMEENIMGYWSACDYVFTPNQIDAVRADYMSADRTFLRTGYVPNIALLQSAAVINEPANQATTDFYNSVYVDWEDVAGATSYLVEFTDGAETFQYQVNNASEMLVVDLKPNKTYLWTIQAMNDYSACNKTVTQFLFTNEETTSVNETTVVEEVVLAPNPTDANTGSTLILSLENEINGQITIYNIAGSIMMDQKVHWPKGKNKISIDTKDFQTGIYVIKVQTTEGIITETLIIK